MAETLATIMKDERWHITWVREALSRMVPEYGRDAIQATLKRLWEADQAVYEKTVKEHGERIRLLSA